MHGVIGRKSNFQASPRGTCDLVKGPSTLLPARSNRHFYFQPSFEYPFNNGKQRNHLRLNLSKWIDRFCYAFLHLVIIGEGMEMDQRRHPSSLENGLENRGDERFVTNSLESGSSCALVKMFGFTMQLTDSISASSSLEIVP